MITSLKHFECQFLNFSIEDYAKQQYKRGGGAYSSLHPPLKRKGGAPVPWYPPPLLRACPNKPVKSFGKFHTTLFVSLVCVYVCECYGRIILHNLSLVLTAEPAHE